MGAKWFIVNKRNLAVTLALVGGLAFCGSSQAVLIGGVEFPEGTISFADSVVSYEPDFWTSTVIPTAANSDPSNALGVPEVPGNTSIGACTGTPSDCPFVSLGRGGRITLQFTDNLLTGSDSTAVDLWIFEVGPDIEDTFVELSANGTIWTSVGKVFGTTSGIDIDAYGFSSVSSLRYVRLQDDPNEGGNTGASVGADIDAVGAISTRAEPLPLPGSLALICLGLTGIGYQRRRKAQH